MLKNLLTLHSAEIGLVLFFLSFVVITLWTVTRSRKEVADWSTLPLSNASDPEPKETE